MDWVMRVVVGVVAILVMATDFQIGQVGATAQALDQAAASTHASVSAMQRTPLMMPIGAAPAPATATAPMARAANDTTAAGAPPSGGDKSPGTGGPGAPGSGGPGGPGKSGPFSHQPPVLGEDWGHAKTMSAVLGEIVWLMSQSPLHKQFFISDLEWPAAQAANENELMTPALLQQFRTFYAQDRPLGVVLWATVSDEVAARLSEGTTKLRPQDWKSGDKLWVMPEACFQHDEVIAPACPGPRHASDEKRSGGGAEEMVKDLKANVFPAREVRYLAVTSGKQEVRVL